MIEWNVLMRSKYLYVYMSPWKIIARTFINGIALMSHLAADTKFFFIGVPLNCALIRTTLEPESWTLVSMRESIIYHTRRGLYKTFSRDLLEFLKILQLYPTALVWIINLFTFLSNTISHKYLNISNNSAGKLCNLTYFARVYWSETNVYTSREKSDSRQRDLAAGSLLYYERKRKTILL